MLKTAHAGKFEAGTKTPRSKHYGVKYNWFPEHLKPNNIEVLRMDTTEQRAGMFTKSLRTDKFELNRKQLVGWLSSTIMWPIGLCSKGSLKMTITHETVSSLRSPVVSVHRVFRLVGF